MRILFITNYYPPSKYGWGYMQLCEEVADGLHARGHTLAVLTSTRRDGAEPARPYPVHRLLHISPDWQSHYPAAWQFFVNRRRHEQCDLEQFAHLLSVFQPQVVFVWHAFGLSRRLLQMAEQSPSVVTVYYLANELPEVPDEYIPYWQHIPARWLVRWLKRPLAWIALRELRREGRPIRLRYDHTICVSRYVRDRLVSQGLIPESAVVIHNGIALERFSPQRYSEPPPLQQGLRCLVAGRVVAEKGIHTAVEAFARLRAQCDGVLNASLTVLGDGPAAYIRRLHMLVEQHRLDGIVTFRPPVPRDEMPRVLSQHNVLLLPSEYAEPIARSMQEAMAMGLLVIGTTTGGSGELLVHGQTGLVFQAGDAGSLAIQLNRALQEPEQMQQLASAGQREVIAHFDIRRTVQEIESYLVKAIGGKS
jgi:glycogen(starch) synthase